MEGYDSGRFEEAQSEKLVQPCTRQKLVASNSERSGDGGANKQEEE